MILNQVFILKSGKEIYKRIYGRGINKNNLQEIVQIILSDMNQYVLNTFGHYNFFNHKISYIYEKEEDILFLSVSRNTNNVDIFRNQLTNLKTDFFNLFKDSLQDSDEILIKEALSPFMDAFHRSLKPKISLVGYSGVGKTTISQLIKADEIPMQHIATINGQISTIKIGNLNFLLWDFAGQEQFSLLWNKFIKGSDAVLIITDSSVENVDKSKNFIELARKEAPYSKIAIIGNKQDRNNALPTNEIERITGVKSYSMVAIDQSNRLKMMHIIADLLEMNAEISPLLRPLIERDKLVQKAEKTLLNGDLLETAEIFVKISDLCMDLGDDSLSREFYEKSIKINTFLKKS